MNNMNKSNAKKVQPNKKDSSMTEIRSCSCYIDYKLFSVLNYA